MLRGDKPGPFRLVAWCAGVGWVLFVGVLVLIHYARPDVDYGILRYFDVPIREHWLLKPKNSALIMLMLCGLCCVCGIIRARNINKMMHLAALSLIALAFLCVSFTLAILS
ncbi:hypothetical protein FIU82_08145 [Pseudoalteromonas sp. THAF3]|nr:hypothetical protein FIU82_08145 [Pseudoalteromonas sp. THAF3]